MSYELRSTAFRRERHAGWRELERLLARVERHGLGTLGAEELHRLPTLYRAAVSSLSVARSIPLDRNLIRYLEALSQRAYVQVYGAKQTLLPAAAHFFRVEFPRRVAALRPALAVAAALLLIGTAAGFLLTVEEPERFYAMVPAELARGRGPTSDRDELAAALHRGGLDGSTLTVFASFLFSHNARIGLQCFALGFAAGVPVALLVLGNGLTLGAFAALYARHDLGVEFWAWVLPHGVTELLAVCICAAAGLSLGHALVFPGPLSRLDALARRGREAAAVVVGAVAMFFVAAVIEGFFRQLVHDTTVRLVVAVATAVLWAAYFVVQPRSDA